MKKIILVNILISLILFILVSFVTAVAPVFQSASITSIPAGYDETSTLYGWCNAADADTVNISYGATWYKNDEVYEESLSEYISAGNLHSCGILTNGSTYCWGLGSNGRLGYGGTTSQSNPIAVNLSSIFKIISTGTSHSCGILTNGSAYCWGYAANGELGNGSIFMQSNNPIAVNISSTFKSISAGHYHTCGILTNGSAYCWGTNLYGELGYGGNENQANPIAVNISSTFKSISAGYYTSCGVLTNGSAYCWGLGSSGQLGYGGNNNQANPIAVNTTSTFKSISAGGEHNCGLLTNGSAYCWGYGRWGQLGYGDINNQSNPIAVNISSTFKIISAGTLHTCGILINGSVYCWGYEYYGELGDGGNNMQQNPVAVNISSTFKSISAGESYTCGILNNGTAYCWGFNNNGQLGDGGTTSQNNPKAVNTTDLMISLFTQGVTSNIDTITYGLTAGENWSFECSAYDGITSATNFDSSTITITNNAPGGGDAVPEFSDYGLLLVMIIGITGFFVVRRKE